MNQFETNKISKQKFKELKEENLLFITNQGRMGDEDGSTFKGAINNNNEGEVSITLDQSSTLTLTGDTYIKSLSNEDSTNSNINLNGYRLYIDGKEFNK